MKLIHLSDLHLGKRLNEFSLIEDQEYILKEIIHIIDNENPDGIIIAGDVYDKSVPSGEAVELFDDFLQKQLSLILALLLLHLVLLSYDI
ncbi:MAG: exonuclease subunit SbcD [Clostridia bacterium]|nr:exonuclease subunit SbcD [Clostridia bacterium]